MEHEIDSNDTMSNGMNRRQFLGAAGVAASLGSVGHTSTPPMDSDLDTANAKLNYLTHDRDFFNVERGNPFPYNLPHAKLLEIGMTRESWKLDVVADPESNSNILNPMSRAKANAFDWPALMKLAETRAVRFLKVMTCNNLNVPLGMGLWEGVPLRDVIWRAKPVDNIRRVFYYGHHNEEPKQMFQSSISISRVLEDPPGENPIILCYKLNGEFLTGKRGGPVRMIVPEAYGFKSVKWLQRVLLTNLMGANDTYANENNDIDSWMKTFARFISVPKTAAGGDPIVITGQVQVGVGGLSRVEYWFHKSGQALPKDDLLFLQAPWKSAQILGPPTDWGGGIKGLQLPVGTSGFDPASGKPLIWPQRYAVVHWTARVDNLPAGRYQVRCRTVDLNGIPQPMPRPFGKSGINSIDVAEIDVR